MSYKSEGFAYHGRATFHHPNFTGNKPKPLNDFEKLSYAYARLDFGKTGARRFLPHKSRRVAFDIRQAYSSNIY